MFIGREKELQKLNQLYTSNNFEFVVMYGRRRVGKTTLINEFCKSKKFIYYTSIESTLKNNLIGLSKSIFASQNNNSVFNNLEDIFEYIHDISKNERLILVIDEYPYFASSDKSISSILQAYIDTKFKNTKLFLILCGSSMSFMENQVLGYQSPLYGRRTAQFKIKPFDYLTSSKFCANYSCEDKALVYGITGGIPHYLDKINPNKNIRQNIIDNFFDPNGYFFEEPSNLLKQELREPQIYNAIIDAIAKGSSRLNEIATTVGIETGKCSNYISSLISLEIIEKEKPFDDENSKRSIYKITDNMFKFWYRFVSSNISAISFGNGEDIYDMIFEPKINEYMGAVFENMCMQYLQILNSKKQLEFMFFKIGRWWGNNPQKKEQVEIDIIAGNQDEHIAIFAECKYKNTPITIDVYDKLVENSNLLKSYTNNIYYIFSKSSFVNNIPCKLITLEDMYTV